MKNNLEKFKKFKTDINTIFGGDVTCDSCFGMCGGIDHEDIFNNCWDFCVQQYCGGHDPIPKKVGFS